MTQAFRGQDPKMPVVAEPVAAPSPAITPPPTLTEPKLFTDDADADELLLVSEEPRGKAPLLNRVLTMCAVVLPFAGMVTAMVLLWGVAFNWVYLALLGGSYLLTAIGITVGYHRYFTHKSFETNAAMRAILGVLGSAAIEGSVIQWVATHRQHHQHSDDHDDPHSPHAHGPSLRGMLRGFVHAHIGWFFKADSPNLMRYVPDLQADPVTRWVSKNFPLWVAMSVLLPAVIGGLVMGTWQGALLGLLWGSAVRIFLVHHVTWSINSVCHLWGTRPFKSHDESRNNMVFGILALGEGWHNAHHAFPTSARHGLRWWELDIAYIIIRGMELVGLASNVKVPSAERVAAKRRA